LVPRPNSRNALPKRGLKSMPEVNFPQHSFLDRSLTKYHAEPYSGNYRNAKLEISDWTAAGAYDDEDSDEEESEVESEDV